MNPRRLTGDLTVHIRAVRLPGKRDDESAKGLQWLLQCLCYNTSPTVKLPQWTCYSMMHSELLAADLTGVRLPVRVSRLRKYLQSSWFGLLQCCYNAPGTLKRHFRRWFPLKWHRWAHLGIIVPETQSLPIKTKKGHQIIHKNTESMRTYTYKIRTFRRLSNIPTPKHLLVPKQTTMKNKGKMINS